ncbi:MAG: ATP-binding cassette domain-containing protein [Oceanospirillaceae bacterium]|nr:ATP-binding cassette domain-containing protein [Oceanospirillaceae bacterium]
MGPSGCGKSSLLSAIAGALPSAIKMTGELILANKSLNLLPIERRGIGLQYQQDLLFPHLNVAGNLLFALPRGDKGKRATAVEAALESANMQGFGERDVATLSGGQRARISLLRTLLARPKLLLLDEPFSRLDDELRQDFRLFVFAQIKRMKIPAILVSHDRQDCPNKEYYALSLGKMVALGDNNNPF